MKFIAPVSFLLLAAVVKAQGTFNAAAFPPPNAVPPITSPEVQAWLKEVDFSKVPKHPIHTGNPPACPPLAQIPQDQCWWTCQTCPGTDIESCPQPNAWGITFDDGPTQFTPRLLNILKQRNIKATFFVMGSNVIQNPKVLEQEVAEGHHIASHTWSHHPLTTLSNEQVVAEVKWVEKAVHDITGKKMKYIRPPYGDIDNRVRAIISQLGYTVVDWTSDAFDTKDFGLNAGYTEATLNTAVTNFQNNLKTYAAAPGAKGFITLEHDLYNVTVEFADRLLPILTQTPNLKPQTVAACLGDDNGYQGGSAGNGTGNGGSGNGNGGNKGGNGSGATKPGSAAGAIEISFKAMGAAAVVALAGSMGMFM